MTRIRKQRFFNFQQKPILLKLACHFFISNIYDQMHIDTQTVDTILLFVPLFPFHVHI